MILHISDSFDGPYYKEPKLDPTYHLVKKYPFCKFELVKGKLPDRYLYFSVSAYTMDELESFSSDVVKENYLRKQYPEEFI